MKSDVNESLVVLRPKLSFVDWVNSLDDDPGHYLRLVDVQEESGGYYIPPYENQSEAMDYLKSHSKEILEREFSDWSVDEEEWPEERDYNTLCEYFEIILCPSIFELDDEPVKPEMN